MRYRPRRRDCDLPVLVCAAGLECEARAVSICSTGLLVRGLRSIWGEITVKAPDAEIELPCRVAWSKDDRTGIEFAEPQSKAALRAARLYPD